MFVVIQILTILGMMFMTYVAFLSFGTPKTTLLYTKDDKDEWDKSLNKGLGKWFTATNIIGSLTSLATAYLFFIGNSKSFGWVMCVCSLTIWFGSFVTNYFTKKITSDDYVKKILESKQQVGGVISTLFWRPQQKGSIHTAVIIKYLSILNILGVIWLEFALFSDIASKLFLIEGLFSKLVLIFSATVIVVFFTVKFGLRGYVFADFFQSPFLFLSVFCLILGAGILIVTQETNIGFKSIFTPLASNQDCIMFGLHVFFLNSFLVLVTEGHWLRIWIFGKKETDLQAKSLLATGILWLLLIFIGFGAYQISGGKLGQDAVASLLLKLNHLSPIFIIFFWLGGIAALFSTADAQIYSLLLVNEFNSKTGALENKLMDRFNPLLLAVSFAVVFTLFYFIEKTIGIPFEKIVFMIIPFSLNVLPAFIRLSKEYPPKPFLMILSVILYSVCSVWGFMNVGGELFWNLLAVMMPIGCSIVALKR